MFAESSSPKEGELYASHPLSGTRNFHRHPPGAHPELRVAAHSALIGVAGLSPATNTDLWRPG